MKLKLIFKSFGWILTGILAVTALVGGVYIVMNASEPTLPPTETEIAALKSSSKTKPRGTGKTYGSTGLKLESDSSSKFMKNSPGNKSKIPMISPMIPNRTGTFNKLRSETEAKNKDEYDKLQKDRRIDREKKRYERMDERIERLEKRLESLKNNNGTEAQIKRLEGSIDRLKKRKKELQEKLQKDGAL